MDYRIGVSGMRRAHLCGLCALILLGLMVLPLCAQTSATPVTADDSAATMWDLSDLSPTPEAWSQAYARPEATVDKLDSYRGTLGRSASAMFSALDSISTTNKELGRLFVYASLKADEDLRVADAQERRQQAQLFVGGRD